MIVKVHGRAFDYSDIPDLSEISGLTRRDHVAFVAYPSEENDFRKYWQDAGLVPLTTLVTRQYPARHTGFVTPSTESDEPMVALSVSSILASPIYRFRASRKRKLRTTEGAVVPGHIQHVAYAVDTTVTTIDAVVEEVEARRFRLITPVLTSQTGDGVLKQVFVAGVNMCFAEIVERCDLEIVQPGNTQGFATTQIDVLYSYLNAYYQRMGW